MLLLHIDTKKNSRTAGVLPCDFVIHCMKPNLDLGKIISPPELALKLKH